MCHVVARFTDNRPPLHLASISGRQKRATTRADELVALVQDVTRIKRAKRPRKPMGRAESIPADAGSIELIAHNLQRLQEDGRQGSFVIFVAKRDANYYIQFAGSKGEPGLYAEAVENEYIAEGFKLDEDQLRRLEELGWELGTSYSGANYAREWLAETDAERREIAEIVVQTFTEAYGVPADHPLEAELNLE